MTIRNTNKNNLPVGRQLTKLRIYHGITMTKLAEALGVTQPRLSQIEKHNENPTLNIIVGICDFFDIEFEYFLDEANTPEDYKRTKAYKEEETTLVYKGCFQALVDGCVLDEVIEPLVQSLERTTMLITNAQITENYDKQKLVPSLLDTVYLLKLLYNNPQLKDFDIERKVDKRIVTRGQIELSKKVSEEYDFSDI